MLAQPQRLRRFAVHVLLVWLFALGSAVANACVVHPGSNHGAAAMAHWGDVQDQVSQPEEIQAAGGDHECDHGRPPCERLCDGPSVVPQAEKQQSNPIGGFWMAAAPIPSFNFQSRAEPDGSRASTNDHRRTPVPIPIAFLRLAL